LELLDALANTPNPKQRATKKVPVPPAPKEIRRALARNPAATAEILDTVLFYHNARSVGSHPNATPELLARLADLYSYGPELAIVAAHPNTSPETLRRIHALMCETSRLRAYDASSRRWARFALREIEHLALPTETAHELLTHTGSNDKYGFCLNATQDGEFKWDSWNESARYRPWWLRLANALNPYIPSRFLEEIAEDGCRLVRAVARIRLQEPERPLLGLRRALS
jgi:hypothetical protein